MPIAYFTVLMWVVCATVLARLFGPMLIEATSGTLSRILSKRVSVNLSGDEIVFHLFESRLLSNINSQLLIRLMRDLAKLPGLGMLVPVPVETFALQKILVPEQYWSGCPPNRF